MQGLAMISAIISWLIEKKVKSKPSEQRSSFDNWLWSKRPGTYCPWDFRDRDKDGYDDRFEPQKGDEYYQ